MPPRSKKPDRRDIDKYLAEWDAEMGVGRKSPLFLPDLSVIELPTPSRAWIDRLIGFANLADASELRDPTLTTDDRRSLRRLHSGLSADDEWMAKAPDYIFNWTDAEATQSQEKLRETLCRLVRYGRRTPTVDIQLRKALRRIRTHALAGLTKQLFSLVTLDQWWGLGLLALLKHLEELEPTDRDRVRQCKFKKCSDFFIDWPGRRGGQRKLYCSSVHAKAAESQRARDKTTSTLMRSWNRRKQ